MNAQHLSIDELADAAEGLLDPDRVALVESHLASCAACQSQSEALREVSAALGGTCRRPCRTQWPIAWKKWSLPRAPSEPRPPPTAVLLVTANLLPASSRA